MLKAHLLTLPSKLTALISKTTPVTYTYKDLLETGPQSLPMRKGHLSLKELFRQNSPSITSSKTGLFGVPLLTSKGFEQFWELSYDHCEELLSQIINGSLSAEETVRKVDDLSNTICLVADALTFISEQHRDDKIAQLAKCCNEKALEYVERLNTNTQLFKAMSAIMEDKDVFEALDVEAQYVVKSFVFDFEQSGIHLPEQKRSEFIEMLQSISRVGSDFLTSCYEPVHVPAAQCIEQIYQQIPKKGQFVVVENTGASHPFNGVREFMWTTYHKTDERREQLLIDVLKSRQHLAQHVGFDNFAQRELKGTMAGSVTNVQDFLTELKYQLTPFVKTELEHLQFAKANLTRHDPTEQVIHPWDAQYYIEERKNSFLEKHCYSNGMFSDLLNPGNLMEGIVLFIERVFGINLVAQLAVQGELWCDDAVKFSVTDEQLGLLGFIYCDLYEREGKQNTMCLHTIRCGTKTQLPVVVIQGNLAYKATMKYTQLESLFHEFGHALHSMLARTTYQHVSGTRCPTDMAEIPSILMENFLGHPRVFTNITMPHMVYKPATDMENYPLHSCYNALATETHLFYSMLDLTLHTEPDINNTTDVIMKVQEEYSHIPYLTGSSWQHRFSHLYTYGARYYSYLWSKSIANIIYQDLFQHDPMCRTSGEQVKEFLKQGSIRDPKEMVEELIGSKLTVESMVESLIKPIRHFNDGYLVHQDMNKNW